MYGEPSAGEPGGTDKCGNTAQQGPHVRGALSGRTWETDKCGNTAQQSILIQVQGTIFGSCCSHRCSSSCSRYWWPTGGLHLWPRVQEGRCFWSGEQWEGRLRCGDWHSGDFRQEGVLQHEANRRELTRVGKRSCRCFQSTFPLPARSLTGRWCRWMRRQRKLRSYRKV